MNLSIIIPSFMRADLLEWGLFSYSRFKIPFDYEIIVLNDGIIDKTEKVCKSFIPELPIKYVFIGDRNLKGEIKWRIPAFAINKGLELAQGDNVIITGPEIFHVDNPFPEMIDILYANNNLIVNTQGRDDQQNIFLSGLRKNLDNYNALYNKLTHPLSTKLPFFMAINRNKCLQIGGYCLDYQIGVCYDDIDFVDRLEDIGLKYHTLNYRIVHLFHPRLKYGVLHVRALWNINKNLYLKKRIMVKK